MELVEITYIRNNNGVEKKAIVSKRQANDIKRLLGHIKIIHTAPAPKGSKRDYTLNWGGNYEYLFYRWLAFWTICNNKTW